MDKIIKTLHLRLDSTSKSLTKNAVSQLIIRILFQSEKPLSINQISTEVNRLLQTSISEDRIIDGIEKLLEKNEIKINDKKYSLTKSNVKILEKRYNESKERLERIIDNYFVPFNSDRTAVLEWFSDATVEFFKSYSIEWISDLCYTKTERLKTKKEDILDHIKRRTKHNKELHPDDFNMLIEKFIECIIYKKDPDLDAHLWQYGTSAFAANLLQSSVGADPMSINAFRDSKCVLDTNVLMNIGLEASEYHEAIKKLENVFEKLNIDTGYFHITEVEYTKTISNKKKEILRAVGKFSYDVLKATDDHFLQSAIKRKCYVLEDYETFCSQIALPPKRLDSSKEIRLFNNDEILDREIETAQNDEEKKALINSIYKKATGNFKRESPLLHDVGIVAGVEYLRKNEKAFILSQEISVNRYSHTKPIKDDLPIAIKLETLINMLAIDNGGTDVNPLDFSTLFANMIRFDLHPDNHTFQIADLSKLLDTELQIEQLPDEEVLKIAKNLHNNRLKGLPEEEISLSLNREFQEVKLKFIKEYDVVYENLSLEKRENEIKTKRLSKAEEALKNRIRTEEIANYEAVVFKSKMTWFLYLPICAVILTACGIYYLRLERESRAIDYVIGLVVNIVFWIFSSVFFSKPYLYKKQLLLKNNLDLKVESRFENETR
ncbi:MULTISPECIES: hypothetical protein [Flavobacterium]|uniref:hypothetical protein n=1 Tax=Flavobacterium TaxID=237 RepID=UPI0011827E7B|nr:MULTISPECIES: hypothetical protein [Flavobacterium]MCR4032512.1 hypothetical protein [Flavobacterium panacis]